MLLCRKIQAPKNYADDPEEWVDNQYFRQMNTSFKQAEAAWSS